MRVPCSQENLSDKDFDEQTRENSVTARTQSGHEGEELSVGSMPSNLQGIQCSGGRGLPSARMESSG